MQKGKIIRVANGFLLISFLIQLVTSLMLLFDLGDYELVEDLHKYNGIIFIFLVCAHIILHWGTIKMMFSRK